MDFYQDFLCSNVLYWFKDNVVLTDDNNDEDKDFEALIKENIKGLLPNI